MTLENYVLTHPWLLELYFHAGSVFIAKKIQKIQLNAKCF